MKECGNCTWCCFFLDVPDYNSPVNEYCSNCEPNVGCKIHDIRNKICREFECLWKLEKQIPDSLRPDRCGVVFEPPNGCRTFVGYVDPDNHENWKKPEVQILIQKLVDLNHPVAIYQGLNRKRIVFTIPDMSVLDVREDIRSALERM